MAKQLPEQEIAFFVREMISDFLPASKVEDVAQIRRFDCKVRVTFDGTPDEPIFAAIQADRLANGKRWEAAQNYWANRAAAQVRRVAASANGGA